MTKAVILAAGRGSRMGRLTEVKPKCMTEFGGRPLIEWQTEALREAGIDEIIAAVGYRGELIAPFVDRTITNEIWSETNMVWSLLGTSAEFNEPTIVSYSDIVYSAESIAALLATDRVPAVGYIDEWESLWRERFSNPLNDAESFALGDGSLIVDIGRRVDSLDQIQGQFAGLLKLDGPWFDTLRSMLSTEELRTIDVTSVIRAMIEADQAIAGVRVQLPWAEIDSEGDLEATDRFFEAHGCQMRDRGPRP